MAKNKAKFKFNNGVGALCCSKCGAIIKDGTQFTEDDWLAMKGHKYMKPQYCDRCLERLDRFEK